ncbi:MAG: hypothetical protein JXA20_16960 [Spirochaetes bacterium]|nr:hypothetical protein [Spirochaetota bacterium]
MDNSGQLTFSDDPLLTGINEVYQLVESGSFAAAVEKVDELMNVDPDYPGLIDCYRIAKFWHNRDREMGTLRRGKETAEFFMREWNLFEEYVAEKEMRHSGAYRAAMRNVFFRASDHYRVAFTEHQDTSNDFNLLLNLGDCFLRLEEYSQAIETLEYARSSFRSSARLLGILGEAYFHTEDLPKSLLCFREAFCTDPSEINLDLIRAKPVLDVVEIVKRERGQVQDIREWVPVYGFIRDVFYVRRNLNKHQVQILEKEVYNLELGYQKMSRDQLDSSSLLPRLITKYLLLRDYYEFQKYSFDTLAQIRDRLLQIDRGLFQEFFNSKKL